MDVQLSLWFVSVILDIHFIPHLVSGMVFLSFSLSFTVDTEFIA